MPDQPKEARPKIGRPRKYQGDLKERRAATQAEVQRKRRRVPDLSLALERAPEELYRPEELEMIRGAWEALGRAEELLEAVRSAVSARVARGEFLPEEPEAGRSAERVLGSRGRPFYLPPH